MPTDRITRAVTERALEKATLDELRSLGALCYKFVSPSKRGVPDDIVLLKSVCIFVEFKSPKGGKLSKLQELNIARIREQGFAVFVVANERDARALIEYCKGYL